MSKVRLFYSKNEISDTIRINDKEILHKANDVLLLKNGEKVYIFDGQGSEYRYSITEAGRRSITLEKEATERTENEPYEKITLGIPLVKEQKIELILQKATELGVWNFQPFISERSIQGEPAAGKRERWEKIIQEAARQSERLWLARINDTIDFNDLIKQDFSLKLAASIKGEKISGITKDKYKKILIMAGPEGDFSAAEFEKLKNSGFTFFKLSENILRVETASIAACGIISYFLAS